MRASDPSTMPKVTALVTRQVDGSRAELLVFRHPTAGIQLPAGTVEAGEDVPAALLREVAEETGLTQVRIVRHLGTLSRDLSDDRRAILRQTSFFVGPSMDVPQLTGFTLTRGCWIKVVGEVGAFSEAVYEERDLNVDSPTLLVRFSGWLPTGWLATRLERHFYHLALTDAAPGSWDVRADFGHVFHLYWVPLEPRPQFVAAQSKWLDFTYDRLLTSVRTSAAHRSPGAGDRGKV